MACFDQYLTSPPPDFASEGIRQRRHCWTFNHNPPSCTVLIDRDNTVQNKILEPELRSERSRYGFRVHKTIQPPEPGMARRHKPTRRTKEKCREHHPNPPSGSSQPDPRSCRRYHLDWHFRLRASAAHQPARPHSRRARRTRHALPGACAGRIETRHPLPTTARAAVIRTPAMKNHAQQNVRSVRFGLTVYQCTPTRCCTR